MGDDGEGERAISGVNGQLEVGGRHSTSMKPARRPLAVVAEPLGVAGQFPLVSRQLTARRACDALS